jgi:anti-sigma factor RsiW
MSHERLPSLAPAMTCAQVTQRIARYLAGGLTADLASACEAHLWDCADCVAFFNTYQQTIHVLHTLRHQEGPAEMQARVRRFLERRI